MLFMNPNENRVGIRRTASRPVAEETAAIRAIASRVASPFPPVARGAYRHARPRALVIPPDPPISAV
jgi:hypothetical protein